MLNGKKVLLAISGGIAAYKTPELVRRLKQHGAEVRVAMTHNASCFITPLSLQAVSGHPVGMEVMDPASEAAMGHIDFAKWPDLVLLAPATANMIAKLTHGLADDLVSTLLQATPAPIAIAPAMNMFMYQSPATSANLATLAARKVMLWGPAIGEQACGDIGPGRMLESNELVQHVIDFFTPVKPLLKGHRVAITAGPTREAIDPVRYISNHSSGKMGFALAKAALALGAEVELISGPVNLPTPQGVTRTDVISAKDMLEASLKSAQDCDIFIACAAVADYALAEVASQKIKKGDGDLQLTLVKNPDIVASVAMLANKPFTVGFAAETQNLEDYALSKLARKNLNMIAANDVSNSEIGFNSDHNALSVYWPTGKQHLPATSKDKLAMQLVTLIAEQFQQHTTTKQ